jgi:hypothetical protein
MTLLSRCSPVAPKHRLNEDALGNFRHRPAKFRRSSCPAAARPSKGQSFLRPPPFLAGAALALMGGEYPVFRAALFSIVLSLAFGQNASLLCQDWCPDTTSAACPHQDSATFPSVSAHDNCRSGAGGAVVFVREDARRSAAAPDAQNALAVPRFLLAISHTDLCPGFESGQRRSLEERPLVITLRI